jgi:PAS domain S-box-containing protein
MNDQQKSKQQLIEELEDLRTRLSVSQPPDSPNVMGAVECDRDVTARKKTEEALQKSEELFRAVFESSSNCIIVWDKDYNYLYANRAAIEHVKVDPHKVIGCNIRDGLGHVPEFMQLWMDRVDKVFASGEEMHVEDSGPVGEELVYSESVLSPIRDERGNIFAVSVVYKDATRRKQAEQDARQSHLELRAIYDGMVDGLLIEDIEAKGFVRANRAVCRMLGYSKEELLTMSAADIHRPADLSAALDIFTALVDKRMTMAENVPFLRKDGSLIYADITATHIVYNQRQCMIGFFRDVTKRRQAEEAVKEEQRHLRRLLEMHEQNRKLVAYEIHDGLVQSLVAARMLLEGAKHTIDNHGSDADKESCQGGFQLLGNAVDQARVLMGGQRPLILDERGLLAAIEYLVHEGEKYSSAEILFTHDVKFERLAPPLETAVFRIVQECLTNARRHSQSEKIRVELAQTNGHIKLLVEDWGTGFSPDSVTSSCFGLEGVRERARLFGGKAKIDSTPGKGTRISVELPVVEA